MRYNPSALVATRLQLEVWGKGCGVQVFGFRDWCLRPRDEGFIGCRVCTGQCLGFIFLVDRVQDLEFRVSIVQKHAHVGRGIGIHFFCWGVYGDA